MACSILIEGGSFALAGSGAVTQPAVSHNRHAGMNFIELPWRCAAVIAWRKAEAWMAKVQ
jgi:hypothetical protein